MSTLESNLELLSMILGKHQKEIQQFLLMNFFNENTYKPLSRSEILSEPAQYEYRKISFVKHKFVMLYRIEDTQVM